MWKLTQKSWAQKWSVLKRIRIQGSTGCGFGIRIRTQFYFLKHFFQLTSFDGKILKLQNISYNSRYAVLRNRPSRFGLRFLAGSEFSEHSLETLTKSQLGKLFSVHIQKSGPRNGFLCVVEPLDMGCCSKRSFILI